MEEKDYKKILEEIISKQESFKKTADAIINYKAAGRKIIIDGEDIFQETFYRFIKNKHSWNSDYPAETQFRLLMKSVISNELKTKYKSFKNFPKRLHLVKLKYDPVNELESSFDKNRIISELYAWAALQKNPDIQFVLEKTLQDFSPADISRKFNKNLDSVKYIKKILRKKLNEIQDC